MLEVEALDAWYGPAQALFGVSLSVGAGEVVALLGRNGAGKSTTLRSVMGLVPRRAGRIAFGGTDLSNRVTHAIARHGIGYVPEDRRVFADLTVAENLEVGRRPPRPDAPHWSPARLFDLFPNLAAMGGRSAGRMSGGEQQMLAIARTLMGNPRLVLFDEPSEGLAPRIVEEMARAILAMKAEGLSILLSEQNLHVARLICDRAVILESGRVRYAGSLAEIDATPAIRDAYLAV